MPSTNRPLWLLARRPLLLALSLGFGISLIVSGRFTVRLIADGALSFAFVPLAELAGFALVYRFGPRTLPFAGAVDGFAGTEASIGGGFANSDALVGGASRDTLTGLNAAGLGPLDRNLSGPSLRRGYLRGIGEVATRLGIGARHVLWTTCRDVPSSALPPKAKITAEV